MKKIRPFNLNKTSIKWKLIAYYSLFTFIILFLLWLFQIVFLDDFYKATKQREIKQNAEKIINEIEENNIKDTIQNISIKENLCILILNQNQKIAFQSLVNKDSIIGNMDHFQLIQLYKEAREKRQVLKQVEVDKYNISQERLNQPIDTYKDNKSENEQSLVYMKIARLSSGEEFSVVIEANLSPVSAVVETMKVQLIMLTIILLVIGIFLGIFISKRISKPIIKLNKEAKNISKGDLSVHFDEDGYKEVAELSKTLNFALAEMSKVENLRKEIISNVSHDLRTPITLIQGYSEVMRDFPEEITSENIQIIIDESKRLNVLVENILSLARLEGKEISLKPEIFNVTEEISNMIERYSKMLEKDSYKFSFEYDKTAFIKADKYMLLQAFYNLMNNAVNYTGEDKKVKIRQTILDAKVRIEVIDTGVGISKDNLPYIWDRYYRSDDYHKRDIVGTGLGLSIVKEILDKHKFSFGVITRINKGSTFWVEIQKQEPSKA